MASRLRLAPTLSDRLRRAWAVAGSNLVQLNFADEPADKSSWPKQVETAGEVLATQTTAAARLAAAAARGKRVAFSAVGDTCPLCVALDGKVFDADSPEAAEYSPPLHLHCDCVWVEVEDDQVREEDLFTLKDHEKLQELRDTHGELLAGGQAETALQVPATPSESDFAVHTVTDPVSGEQRSEVEWVRPRQGPVSGETAGAGTTPETAASGPPKPPKGPPAQPSASPSDPTGGPPPEHLRTTAELEAWIRDIAGRTEATKDTEWSFTGAHPDTVREILTRYQELKADWPEVAGWLKRVDVGLESIDEDRPGTMPRSVVAEANSNIHHIRFNLHWMEKAERADFYFASMVRSDLRPEGTCGLRQTFTHEWGHMVIDEAMDARTLTEQNRELFLWLFEHPEARELVLQARNQQEAWAYMFQCAYHQTGDVDEEVEKLRAMLRRWGKSLR